MGFKAFIGEDSSAVLAQIRDIRDQMRVIKLKRDLEKEKLESLVPGATAGENILLK